MARYEQIAFFESNDDAWHVLQLVDNDEIEVAVDYLKQWHYPGEHDTRDEPGYGSDDDVYGPHDLDGYILAVNDMLDYVSLEYDTEYDEGF